MTVADVVSCFSGHAISVCVAERTVIKAGTHRDAEITVSVVAGVALALIAPCSWILGAVGVDGAVGAAGSLGDIAFCVSISRRTWFADAFVVVGVMTEDALGIGVTDSWLQVAVCGWCVRYTVDTVPLESFDTSARMSIHHLIVNTVSILMTCSWIRWVALVGSLAVDEAVSTKSRQALADVLSSSVLINDTVSVDVTVRGFDASFRLSRDHVGLYKWDAVVAVTHEGGVAFAAILPK